MGFFSRKGGFSKSGIRKGVIEGKCNVCNVRGDGIGDQSESSRIFSPRCIYETRYIYAYCTELYISITQANSIRKGCTSCAGLGWGGSTYDRNTLPRTCSYCSRSLARQVARWVGGWNPFCFIVVVCTVARKLRGWEEGRWGRFGGGGDGGGDGQGEWGGGRWRGLGWVGMERVEMGWLG